MHSEGISWKKVKPGKILVGSNNRSILFGGPGPRHEESLEYEFMISEAPVIASKVKDLTISLGAEIASESEWELAYSRGLIRADDGEIEILADSSDNYWGKKCDGRPIVREGNFPQFSRKWKGNKSEFYHTWPQIKDISEIGSSGQAEKRIRLVIRGKGYFSEKPALLPKNRDQRSTIIEELMISMIIGIIPSFVWAFFNARPGYIEEGWLNLILGGIFIGLFSGIFWRPKQATWIIEGEEMRPKKV